MAFSAHLIESVGQGPHVGAETCRSLNGSIASCTKRHAVLSSITGEAARPWRARGVRMSNRLHISSTGCYLEGFCFWMVSRRKRCLRNASTFGSCCASARATAFR